MNSVPLPLSVFSVPNWLVPASTNRLAVAAQGTAPITMDIQQGFGDPDVLGVSSGNNSAAVMTDPELAPGFDVAFPDATGPFITGTTGTVNLAAVATTNPFDSAVTASSGDVWAQSVNLNATYTPLSLGPGQTGTITLTITPNAAKGTVVHGFIGVDTFNLATDSGDELVNIPTPTRSADRSRNPAGMGARPSACPSRRRHASRCGAPGGQGCRPVSSHRWNTSIFAASQAPSQGIEPSRSRLRISAARGLTSSNDQRSKAKLMDCRSRSRNSCLMCAAKLTG